MLVMELPCQLKLVSTTLKVPRACHFHVGMKWKLNSPIRSPWNPVCYSNATALNIVCAAQKHNNKKKKAVFILGPTGSGKSKLSVDLATHFPAEIINSDKIQVYKGLDIAGNKITQAESKGVPHHLLGFVHPDADFTIQDFRDHVHKAMNQIIENGRIPIIVGGSNSYIEGLVEDTSVFNFKANFECCFLWMDVALPILYEHVSKRVDKMVDAGLVDEVRKMFVPGADYTRGIRRTIGVPEMDRFFHAEREMADETTKRMLLDIAIDEIKYNTWKLVNSQIWKIGRLRNELGWKLHRIYATSVFERSGQNVDDAWKTMVLKPSLKIIGDFLEVDEKAGEEDKLVNDSHNILNWSQFSYNKSQWNITAIQLQSQFKILEEEEAR